MIIISANLAIWSSEVLSYKLLLSVSDASIQIDVTASLVSARSFRSLVSASASFAQPQSL